jgi:hypothetical protein
MAWPVQAWVSEPASGADAVHGLAKYSQTRGLVGGDTVRPSTGWVINQSALAYSLRFVARGRAARVLTLLFGFALSVGCPCPFQQLCRVKVSGPKFRNKTRNSRVVSKGNFQKGISRFESCHPSQPVGSLDFCLGTSRKSSRTRRFVRFRRSPIRPRSHRTSQFLRKISRRCLKNSRFRETRSGDWFDHRLRDRANIRCARYKGCTSL